MPRGMQGRRAMQCGRTRSIRSEELSGVPQLAEGVLPHAAQTNCWLVESRIYQQGRKHINFLARKTRDKTQIVAEPVSIYSIITLRSDSARITSRNDSGSHMIELFRITRLGA